MATVSRIEWTERTWNPVTGCTKISAGCKNCYAERMAVRLQGIGLPQYARGFELALAPQVLDQPYRWRAPAIVFVNSMSDIFHEDVPLGYIRRIFSVIEDTPHHTYQILTKRSARMRRIAKRLRWPRNLWMGVSVENADTLFRVDDLRVTPARIRFLSLEPLLGPLPSLDLSAIDWVIIGGESGPRARPIAQEWVRAILTKCARMRVPVFFKQWGHKGFNPNPRDPTISKEHPQHAKGGCQVGGRVFREMPSRNIGSAPNQRMHGTRNSWADGLPPW